MADLNDGMVFGEVTDRKTKSPIEGARGVVTYIQADPGLPPIRLSGDAFADTDENGLFVIKFQWSPLQLGSFIEDNPRYHLSVVPPTPDADHPTVKPYQTERIGQDGHLRLYMVVSLRAVANGGIPDFRKPDSVAKTIATEIVKKWRDYKRFPAIRIMQASPENYGLLGFVRATLSEPTVASIPMVIGKWHVTIGDWHGLFAFYGDGSVWWANNEYSSRTHGVWRSIGNEIHWSFRAPGDFRTFTVQSKPGFVTSVSGRILPEGQGFFEMTRAEM